MVARYLTMASREDAIVSLAESSRAMSSSSYTLLPKAQVWKLCSHNTWNIGRLMPLGKFDRAMALSRPAAVHRGQGLVDVREATQGCLLASRALVLRTRRSSSQADRGRPASWPPALIQLSPRKVKKAPGEDAEENMSPDYALSSSRLRCDELSSASGAPACLETCAVAVGDGRDDRLVSPAAVEGSRQPGTDCIGPQSEVPVNTSGVGDDRSQSGRDGHARL